MQDDNSILPIPNCPTEHGVNRAPGQPGTGRATLA
jgi:hypothetical protein